MIDYGKIAAYLLYFLSFQKVLESFKLWYNTKDEFKKNICEYRGDLTMKNELILQLKNRFDNLIQKIPESDIEFWYARELMEVLEYDRWENFSKVIERAITACKNSGTQVENHFRGATKMVKIGSGAERQIDDIILTRYACYLIAQ